jgi:hypothetical protein
MSETGEGWVEAAEEVAEHGMHIAGEAAWEVGTEAVGIAEHVPGFGTIMGGIEAAPHLRDAVVHAEHGTPEQVHQDMGEAGAGFIGGLGGGLGYDLLAGMSRAGGTDTPETAPWWGSGGEQAVADAFAYNLGGGTNPHSAAPAPLPEATQGPAAPSREDDIPPPPPPAAEDPNTQTVRETVITADEARGK